MVKKSVISSLIKLIVIDIKTLQPFFKWHIAGLGNIIKWPKG